MSGTMSRSRKIHWLLSQLLCALLFAVLCTAPQPLLAVPPAARPAARPAPSETPHRVDTLWTRTPKDYDPDGAIFSACALGGTPPVMAVLAGVYDKGYVILIIDPLTGDTLGTKVSGHTGEWRNEFHISFARNANVFVTSEVGRARVWSWPQLEMLLELTDTVGGLIGKSDPATVITSDGRRVYYANAQAMFDVQTGDTLWRHGVPGRYSGYVCNTIKPKITADDRYIALSLCKFTDGIGWGNDGVDILDAATGKRVEGFSGGSGGHTLGIGISDDGSMVAISRDKWETPEPGSIVVYDRVTGAEIFNRPLIGGRDSTRAGDLIFAPGGAGLFVNDAQDGRLLYEPWHPTCEFFPAWDSVGTHIFRYWGSRYSPDWTVNVGLSGGFIAASRVDLRTVTVPQDASWQDPTPPAWVYPNPSDGQLTVTLDGSSGTLAYQLADMSGRQVASGTTTVTDGSCTMAVHLPPGIYLLRLVQPASERVVSSSYVMIR